MHVNGVTYDFGLGKQNGVRPQTGFAWCSSSMKEELSKLSVWPIRARTSSWLILLIALQDFYSLKNVAKKLKNQQTFESLVVKKNGIVSVIFVMLVS